MSLRKPRRGNPAARSAPAEAAYDQAAYDAIADFCLANPTVIAIGIAEIVRSGPAGAEARIVDGLKLIADSLEASAR